MKWLLVLPLLVPFAAAVASLFAIRSKKAQRIFGIAGSGGLLAASIVLLSVVNTHGIQVMQIGDWPAPFGISFVADLFGAIMVVLAGIIGFAASVYSLATIDEEREKFGYYPLLNILLMGVCGSFLTGDIFNMYVWFEVMLMASFVLLALGNERSQIEGTIKYISLNLVSSALFLAGVAILYGMVGTLNMADLAHKLVLVPRPELITVVAMLFLVAFGIKAAVFPLFFWLPASYHTPPFAVSAVFAGLLTKVGVYALIRVFSLLFIQDVGYTHWIILTISGFTMIVGVLGAACQNEFRRILSFHIVSQIGYMIMGLGLFTPLALAGSVFYLIHHIIVKANLFLVSGIVHRLRGTSQLKELGGIYKTHPGISILFLIPALSLAGIPPLSGFFAKFILIKDSLDTAHYLIAATALFVSILTLFSMTKIWNEVFWKPAPAKIPSGHTSRPGLVYMVLPVAFLALLTILLGIAGQPILALSIRAGEQLINTREYITAVLGARI